MIHSQNKGKRMELFFLNKLKSVFPDIRRTGFLQSRDGGVDLTGTAPFDFEVKSGKQWQIVKVRQALDQAQSQGSEAHWKVVLVKPDREEPYVILSFADFQAILENMHAEQIF